MSGDAAPPQREKRVTEGLVGELIGGRYRIEHKLGEGAMGAVYRARHVKIGRPFAIKVIHPHLLEDRKTALRFEREAELAGRLRHPNVIGVVDVGETPDGVRYMVMDYVQGSDLAGLLAEAPMPPARIIPLVRQMLEGLCHAHEAGLIHRDFKPENVLVEKDDHGREIPRIVDFGISILADGGASADGTGRLTTNGLVLGTPHYMAPEQAMDEPIDHRIDLFALGIVVYEMLCGQLPFDGSGAEVARANLLIDPPPIARRVPGLEVDPLLEAYARHLMAKSRDHRPANARAARELLDLIERDRAAAAAALGLTAAAARGPLPTEPMPPQPPTPLRVPTSVRAPQPLHAAHPTQPAAAATTMADPLPWTEQRPPRRRWLIAGGAGLVVGAAAVIALVASGGGGAKQPEGQVIAMTAEPTAQTAAAAPTPAPTLAPTPPAPAAPQPAPPETAGAATPSTDPDPRATRPEASAGKRTKKGSHKSDLASARTKPDSSLPEVAKVSTGSGQDKPAPAKAAAESAAPDKEDANQRLLAEYRQLNSELTALEKAQGPAATGDLWLLYRHVGYYAAIQDESKRQTLIANLATIGAELARRKKR
jgi:serine/threonine protein kinase